jgi:cullin 3
MYKMFVRLPASVDYLRDALADRIKTRHKQLIANQVLGQANPAVFVRGVLQMRQQYDSVTQISFLQEKKAQKRMRESFEDFLNTDARAASCLAVYVDEFLRVGLRGATEEQVNAELQKQSTYFGIYRIKMSLNHSTNNIWPDNCWETALSVMMPNVQWSVYSRPSVDISLQPN